MRRFYPQLRNVALTHTWSARMAYAVHRMPQIGELAPGLWVAGAFADHGINTTAMAGDLIARAIHEGDDRWRQFSPYGLVWTGGRVGRTVTAVALKLVQAKAWLRESLARGRAVAVADEPDAAVSHAQAPAAPTPTGIERSVKAAQAPASDPQGLPAGPTKKKRSRGRRKVARVPALPQSPGLSTMANTASEVDKAGAVARRRRRRHPESRHAGLGIPSAPSVPAEVGTANAPGDAAPEESRLQQPASSEPLASAEKEKQS